MRIMKRFAVTALGLVFAGGSALGVDVADASTMANSTSIDAAVPGIHDLAAVTSARRCHKVCKRVTYCIKWKNGRCIRHGVKTKCHTVCPPKKHATHGRRQ